MSTVAVTIQELFETGQSPGHLYHLQKGLESRSGVCKALKRWERQVRPLSSSKTPSKQSGVILKRQGIGASVLCEMWNNAETAKWLEPFPIQKDKNSSTFRGHKNETATRSKASSGEAERRQATSGLVDWWEFIHSQSRPHSFKGAYIYAVNESDIQLNDRLYIGDKKQLP